MVNFNCRIRKNSGFSLLEVLISLTVLALATVALAKVQGLLIAGVGYAEQQSIAVNLAEAKIENYRNYTSIAGSGNSYNNISSSSEVVTQGNTTFNLNWTVTENVDPAYKQINVRVAWTERDGRVYSIDLTSIIGKMDPVREGEIFQGEHAGGNLRPH